MRADSPEEDDVSLPLEREAAAPGDPGFRNPARIGHLLHAEGRMARIFDEQRQLTAGRGLDVLGKRLIIVLEGRVVKTCRVLLA